jgi:hypothetical protein
MPAPIGPLIGFVLGIGFAWAASEELSRAGAPIATRSLALVVLFGLVVFAPTAGFFLAFAPDWAYAYLVDSQRLPAAATIGVVLADAASVPAGFLVAARWSAARRLGPLFRIGMVPALVASAFVLAVLPRLSVQATYAQFHGDFGTRSVSGSLLGYALLWMLTVLAAAVAWTLRSLRMLGQPHRD